MLNTRLILLFPISQRIAQETTLKCMRHLLQIHLEVFDSKLVICTSKFSKKKKPRMFSSNYAFEKEMSNRLNFIAHFTFQWFGHTSGPQIIPSHDLVLRKQPKEDLDKQFFYFCCLVISSRLESKNSDMQQNLCQTTTLIVDKQVLLSIFYFSFQIFVLCVCFKSSISNGQTELFEIISGQVILLNI